MTATAAAVTSATFVFSPVAVTVIAGEIVRARIKHAYHRLTSVLAVRNGVTESTYIAEALIPLIAFGLPLSPVAAGPAAPLFNAPPRFTVDTATGVVNNLHTMMSVSEFLIWGLVSVVIAAAIAYPFAMNHARSAAAFVAKYISHEAIIATFVGLILVIGLWEGGLLALLVHCDGRPRRRPTLPRTRNEYRRAVHGLLRRDPQRSGDPEADRLT